MLKLWTKNNVNLLNLHIFWMQTQSKEFSSTFPWEITLNELSHNDFLDYLKQMTKKHV